MNLMCENRLQMMMMMGKRFVQIKLDEEASQILYCPQFLDPKEAYGWLHSLDKDIPWVRPTLTIFGRSCRQPRDTCYVADEGLPGYKYSSYEPLVHKWDDFPIVKAIAGMVREALPDSLFNSVLLNRYTNGVDYAAWHSDDESVYGPTPTIASVTLGAEREFLLRKKKYKKAAQEKETAEGCLGLNASINKDFTQQSLPGKAAGRGVNSAFDVILGKSSMVKSSDTSINADMLADSITEKRAPESFHSFMLKHGSLLVMRGFTQRDWQHSVPRRKRVADLRINLTFRYIMGRDTRN